MIKKSIKIIGILALIALAGIWTTYLWNAFTIEQSIDSSIKTVITGAIAIIVIYGIKILAPKNK
ncbi:MAG: hypothetical protein WCO66_04020 [Candidatus Absconditabacteria bacterium]